MKIRSLILLILGTSIIQNLTSCEDVRTEKYPSGQVRETTPYQNGQPHGIATRYSENGTLIARIPYSHGKIDGFVEEYHANGKPSSRQTYQQGIAVGEALWYHSNGQLARKIIFLNGQPSSFPSEFDTLGNPLVQGEFQDSRDGKKYPWIRIGDQIWTGANMDFATPTGSLCLQCSNWGRLYDLEAAKQACPRFFRLPTRVDWEKLLTRAGVAPAPKLKAAWGWDPTGNGSYGNGSDELKFGALSGGGHFAPASVAIPKRVFKGAGQRAYYWTSDGIRISIDYRSTEIQREPADPTHGFSVRCLLDTPPE